MQPSLVTALIRVRLFHLQQQRREQPISQGRPYYKKHCHSLQINLIFRWLYALLIRSMGAQVVFVRVCQQWDTFMCGCIEIVSTAMKYSLLFIYIFFNFVKISVTIFFYVKHIAQLLGLTGIYCVKFTQDFHPLCPVEVCNIHDPLMLTLQFYQYNYMSQGFLNPSLYSDSTIVTKDGHFSSQCFFVTAQE